MVANYLRLLGVPGNHPSVPHAANLNGTGTLEFIMKVALDNWTLDADQVWISKWTGTTGYKFSLRAATNDLRLRFNSSRVATATVTPTVIDGDWLWVRVVATEDGVDRDVFFYTSTDTTNNPDNVTWTQLGAEVVIPFGAGDLTTNTAEVLVGATAGAAAETMAGSIAAARINFAGVTELDIDFTYLTTAEVDAGSFTEDSSNAATVTLNGNEWTYVRGPSTGIRFFLDTMIGDGTETNPFRSEHADGAHSIINLKPAQRLGKTLCLVGAEALVGAPVLDFGDTLDDVFQSNRKSQFGNALGLTLELDDLRGIIAEIMLLHGTSPGDGSRWNNIRQNTFGRHKIWLGQGQLVYDAPVIQGTLIGDTFSESAPDKGLDAHTATGPGGGFTWTEVKNNLKVLFSPDEVIGETGVNNCRGRADSDLATDDHYAEVLHTAKDSNVTSAFGIHVRYASGADTHYAAHLRNRTSGEGGDQYRLFETTADSSTLLATVTEDLVLDETYRLEVNGSALECFKEGVSKITATDTVLTGQLRTGIQCGRGYRVDDFKAEDLTVAAVYPPFPRRQLTTVRM